MIPALPPAKCNRLATSTSLMLIPLLGLCLGMSCVEFPAAQETAPLFNFHVVEPGRVYRSGQPDANGLRIAIGNLDLRTVLNLRGVNPEKSWYVAEKAVCDEMGVTHVSYPMSAKSLPSAELLGGVLETLETAEYPILVHCESGSDRTSAIAAIYRIAFLGHDKATAMEEELSVFKLHFRPFAPCIARLVEMFEPTDQWLSEYAEIVGQISCTP